MCNSRKNEQMEGFYRHVALEEPLEVIRSLPLPCNRIKYTQAVPGKEDVIKVVLT